MPEETTAAAAAPVSIPVSFTLDASHPMAKHLDSIQNPPLAGDVVEGTIIELVRGRLYVDLPPWGSGIIYGREYLNAADVLRKVNPGDTITAKVVDPAGIDGYIELSLKEARQAAIWGEAEAAILNGNTFNLTVEEANKGGLILSWQGIKGFLPASQLSKDHYPRVPEGDKDKIFGELLKLQGTMLSVRIITADAKEGKLIFSEKSGEEETEKTNLIDKYQVGDTVDGEVTGAVDFGVFVKLEQGLEGLVHISELDWGLVEDPRTMYAVGDRVQVKVIEIKDGKVSLSIKALKDNPWKLASEQYKKGQEVTGVIIKYNKHGALASIEEGVAGLVHISEFATPAELRETLELGKTYPFTITLFEPKDQRMTLTFTGEKKGAKK
jgi:small subunit ribosomal protein S1